MAKKAKFGGRKARQNPRSSRTRRPILEALERRELFAIEMTPRVIPPTPVAVLEVEPNDFPSTAQVLALGTGAGQSRALNVGGAVNPGDGVFVDSDSDLFAVNLQAGDILDISITGAAGSIDLLSSTGQLIMGSAQNDSDTSQLSRNYPTISPLATTGNSLLSTVIPSTGRYVIRISSDEFVLPDGTIVPPQAGSYVAAMKVYRPFLESQPIGTEQILLLDFDGEVFPRNEIVPGLTGIARIDGIETFLPQFNLLDSDSDAFIDKTVKVVEQIFQDVANRGTNGDYANTGVPGQFSIRIANSRDDGDLWGLPNVSRMIIGSSLAEFGINGIFGIASSIDVGNFDTTESVWVPVDLMPASVGAVPTTGGVAPIDSYAQFLGNTIVHEASHFFGLRHTETGNNTYSLIDSGTQLLFDMGAGVNGIYEGGPGKGDDILSVLDRDRYEPGEGYRGFQDSVKQMAFSLPTGKVGGAITGRVYNDANRDRNSAANEVGVAGVTVFIDRNGNGVFNTGEISALTDATGNFTLPAVAGTYNIVMVLPTGYQSTAPTTLPVTITSGASLGSQNFPVNILQSQTGTVFADVNNNRIKDATEGGISSIVLYADLNGNDRLDFNEPQSVSGSDGAFSMLFPKAGTYTLRAVVPAGYIQTTPVLNGLPSEHTVVYNGTALTQNYDFGLRPVRDFGDLPANYGTASHGIVDGLRIGATVDPDNAQQTSTDALGDDRNGTDDEDGVRLLTTLVRGQTATFEVSTTNTTGKTASLVGYVDLTGDGDFADQNEAFVDQVMGTETRTFSFTLPNDAPNVLNLRFRYGHPQIQPATGDLVSGEVEDYQFIVQATGDVVVDDEYTVPVNTGDASTQDNVLLVLANDFDIPQSPLTIVQKGVNGTQGQVVISDDKRSIRYTPPVGFRGTTSFTYVVAGELVNGLPLEDRTATVTVHVAFQSTNGVAIDDSFNVQENATNVALDVLANDIPGLTGQLTVISARSLGNGTVEPAPGGKAVRYSAPFGGTGTEQFEYTISDGNGGTSKAIGTVHLLAGDLADDLMAFNIVPKNPITGSVLSVIPVGQVFDLEVYAQDLRTLPALAGLGSAYLDLLYNANLVSTIVTDPVANRFGADITFGTFNQVTTGDARTPGIINEVGGTQNNPAIEENRPTTNQRPGTLLFKVRMRADSPGVAEFIGDPADAAISDTSPISPAAELTIQQMRFNRTKLTIVPNGGDFAFAKDDHFLDPFPNTQVQNLNVLANDNPGPSGEIQIIKVTAASNGTAVLATQGTSDPTDDRITYTANQGFNGTDQFTYTIQSLSGELSTATVTVHVGTQPRPDVIIQIDVIDDDTNGTPLTETTVDDEFKVRVSVKDNRLNPIPSAINDRRGVFAGFLDVLFDQNLVEVVRTKAIADQVSNPNSDEALLGFDIDFKDKYDSGVISGDVIYPGVINDVGAAQSSDGSGDPTGTALERVFEVTLRAKRAGTVVFTGDPANENPPFTDTLLFEPPTPTVAISRIQYNADTLTIIGGAAQFTNRINPFDVNDDGDVSPVDALIVINVLNQTGITSLGSGEPGTLGNIRGYIDVNGDNRLTPVDALAIINRLNRLVGAGEPVTASSTAIAHDSASGAATVTTDNSSSASASQGSTASAAPAATVSGETEDEDEDSDYLDLLASDVAGALNS